MCGCQEVCISASVMLLLVKSVHRKSAAHTSDASTRSYQSDCFSTCLPPPALSHSQLQKSFDMSAVEVAVVVITILFHFTLECDIITPAGLFGSINRGIDIAISLAMAFCFL